MRRFWVFAFLPSALLFSAAAMMGDQAKAQDQQPIIDPPAPVSFQSCIACHTVKKDAVSFGPNLRTVVGRKAGSLAGYSYSEALKAADFTWDSEKLDAWMSGPKHVVAGTKMPFPGLPFPERRQEIIAYLSSLR